MSKYLNIFSILRQAFQPRKYISNWLSKILNEESQRTDKSQDEGWIQRGVMVFGGGLVNKRSTEPVL